MASASSTQHMAHSASVHAQPDAGSGVNSLSPARAARGGRGLPVELLMLIVEYVAAQEYEAEDEYEEYYEEESEEEESDEEESQEGEADASAQEVQGITGEGVIAMEGGEGDEDGGSDGEQAQSEAGSDEQRSESEAEDVESEEQTEASVLSWVPGRPLRQLDLASLRLTSKLLCQLATPHFYKVIQVVDFSRVTDLIAQLQARPELCKAIWWNEKPAYPDLPLISTAEPYLVKLANVDEVAWCEHFDSFNGTYPLGIHYALRDVGPWCEPVSFVRPPEEVELVQCTPTLRVHSKHPTRAPTFLSARDREKAEDWRKENPGVREPRIPPWRLEAQSSRAIWAAHITVPALLDDHPPLWELPKTITHLTITLYSHALIKHDQWPDDYVRKILDPRCMPLLEYLDIRVSNIGEGSEGLYNNLERMLLSDEHAICRVAMMETIINHWDGRRGLLDQMDDQWTTQDTLFDDVRDYVLHQWQERVFHNRAGPWKDPMTSFVRPQVVSEFDAHNFVLEEPFEYAPGADLFVNKPDSEDIVRRYALRSSRAGKPLAGKSYESLAQVIREGGADRYIVPPQGFFFS